jgi:uncharacterized membrane protein YeiH
VLSPGQKALAKIPDLPPNADCEIAAMPHSEFLLPAFFDYSATFCWAISGSLVAARRGYDLIGILMLALVSSTGGGLLRDGLFLNNGPPVLVRNPFYLALVVAAALVVILFGKRVQGIPGFERVISLVDGLGMGAYAAVGMSRAQALGFSPLGVVLVGMVNAVGGSVLRSVLVASEPHLFRPGTYESVAALIGCCVFLSLTKTEFASPTTAAWATIVIVFVVRVAAVAYRVETRPLEDFRDDWMKFGRGPG